MPEFSTVSNDPVIAPFADASVSLRPRKSGPGLVVYLLVAILIIIAIAVASYLALAKFVDDPYRTLEPFPVAKYLANYHGLAGSKFRATVHVEADLGWKEAAGRLMLFSADGDARPFVVLVPTEVAKPIYFTKDQTYKIELEVKEGGLIYANSCQKD